MNTMRQYKYVFFLGVNPDLSRAEIEAVLRGRGAVATVEEATDKYLMAALPSPLDSQLQDVLGGSDRFGFVLGTLPHAPAADEVSEFLTLGSKKISLGLSGVGVDLKYLTTLANTLKTWWRDRGGRMRFVLPTGQAERLNAAQVMAHRLDEEPNAELTIVRLRNRSYAIVRTLAVQDIRSYELRDTRRPVRDARVGGLPPKLAQIMINLAAGYLAPPDARSPLSLLDPFCGMGTIVQEGWLMDYQMTGSDSSPRMIKATQKNLGWLQDLFSVSPTLAPRFFIHQADTRWSRRWQGQFDAVVTEPVLGKRVKRPLPPRELARRMDELGTLYHGVFRALLPVLRSGGVVVFALPAWRSLESWQLYPLPFLDVIERLGYSKLQLGNEERGTLLYARPDALVGRELTAWKKLKI